MKLFWEYTIGFSHWKWYRKFCGGHWEKCWVDPCMSSMWMQLNHDEADKSSLRVYGTVERLLQCEDWS